MDLSVISAEPPFRGLQMRGGRLYGGGSEMVAIDPMSLHAGQIAEVRLSVDHASARHAGYTKVLDPGHIEPVAVTPEWVSASTWDQPLP